MTDKTNIARTAWKVGGPSGVSERYARKCPSCKSDEPNSVNDSVRLLPYKEFYGNTKFAVMECWLCGAEWSMCWPKHQEVMK